MANVDYNQKMEDEKAKLIAQQLRKPQGEFARDVAEKMNEGNAFINHATLDSILLKDEDFILEIGMGNGFFVKDLFQKNGSIHYTGCDYSQEMIDQAIQLNTALVKSGKVNFDLGTAGDLPYGDENFDHVFTINTIYFWDDHEKVLADLRRVLKGNGTLTLSIRPKSNMKDFPFVKYGFDMFSQEELSGLLNENGFKVISCLHQVEPDQHINGTSTKVEMLIVTACKI